MSETSSHDDARRQALQNAIDGAALAARRSQRRFWFLSVTWAVVIVFLAAAFIRQMGSLESIVDSTLAQLETQGEEVEALKDELTGMRGTLQELKDTLFSLAALNFDSLPEENRGSLGTQLAEQHTQRRGTSSGGRLSEPERAFLEQFAQNDDQAPLASVEDAYRQGSAALSQGDNDAAVELFREALENFDEPYMPAYLGLGRAYFEAGRFREAIEAFDDGVQAEDSASVRSWRCYAKNHLGVDGAPSEAERYFREALADCNSAIEQLPSYWWSYNTRGFAHLLLGNYDDAVSDWLAAAARHSDPAYALENIGLAYISANQWQEALDHTTEFNRDHGTSSSWNWLARAVATDQLDLDEAEHALERWKELRSSRDVEQLKLYVPVDLHNYIDTP